VPDGLLRKRTGAWANAVRSWKPIQRPISDATRHIPTEVSACELKARFQAGENNLDLKSALSCTVLIGAAAQEMLAHGGVYEIIALAVGVIAPAGQRRCGTRAREQDDAYKHG